jgi:hypothetical protein
MISGGTLNLHGDRFNAWTRLADTAEAGSTSIKVLDASEWRVADEIVQASTDFNPRQAETRHISAVSGTEITVTTERPDVSLSLSELDAGSWVVFELPGFTTAASGTQQNSLDALRRASDTSYFEDQDALWVKVVSDGGPGRGGTSIQVSR